MKLTQKFVDEAAPGLREKIVHDDGSCLVLRIAPSGKKSYFAEVAPKKRIPVGHADWMHAPRTDGGIARKLPLSTASQHAGIIKRVFLHSLGIYSARHRDGRGDDFAFRIAQLAIAYESNLAVMSGAPLRKEQRERWDTIRLNARQLRNSIRSNRGRLAHPATLDRALPALELLDQLQRELDKLLALPATALGLMPSSRGKPNVPAKVTVCAVCDAFRDFDIPIDGRRRGPLMETLRLVCPKVSDPTLTKFVPKK
ncbi:MAG: hypothetical protein CALGDGBN_03554 [Pseudomonadales bacterium]|nr:hypothetical protein [Pseudomonadales bacterium]